MCDSPVSIWDVVDARASPRMTATDPPDGKPCATDRPMSFQSFKRVGAASRMIAAAMSDPGRKNDSVSTHRQGNKPGDRRHDRLSDGEEWARESARRRSSCIAANELVAVTSARPTRT